MARPSHPHRAGGKWRFRWSVTGTREQCIAEATRLRQLPAHEAARLAPEEHAGAYRLRWAVVRATEADITSEYARYCALDDDQPPLTVGQAAQRWAAEEGTRFASWVVLPLSIYETKRKSATFLADVTLDWLHGYKRWLDSGAGGEYEYETRRKFVRYASRVFQWAHDKRWLTTIPRPPRIPQADPNPRPYSAGELAAIYRALRNPRSRHVIPLLRLMLETGLRMKEVRTLRWGYVQWQANALLLPPRAHKGGHATGRGRVVHLTPRALRILARQRGRHREFVFVGNRSGEPYSQRDGLNSILYRGPTKTDPGRPVINPHRLKHTFAQRAIDAGVPPHVVTEMLGQVTSRMVWVYAKLRDPLILAGLERATAQLPVLRAAERQAARDARGVAPSPGREPGRSGQSARPGRSASRRTAESARSRSRRGRSAG